MAHQSRRHGASPFAFVTVVALILLGLALLAVSTAPAAADPVPYADVAGLSNSSASGTNLVDLHIPDNGAAVESLIEISGIPADNYITGVDLHVVINHTDLRDLIVGIADPSMSVYTLLNRDPGKGYSTEIWKSNMPHWKGRSGNGTWRLIALDALTNSLVGYVDQWSIRVYYAPLGTPSPTPTCPVAFSCPTTARVNAGGPTYVDSSRKTWQADRSYASCTYPYFGSSGGDVYANPQPIDGSNDDALFQTQRYFPGPGGYTFDVPAGVFSVTLRFAEIYPSVQVGDRVFDVTAEGRLVVDSLDVLRSAGARYRALAVGFTVPVSDGKLNIDFIGHADKVQPIISGIEIAQMGCGAATATPTATATATPAPPTATATMRPGQGTLSLAPETGSHAAGQTFMVNIVVNVGSQPVDGAQAFLSFDPSVLAVVDEAGNPVSSITSGSAFSNHFANSVNNAAGTIDYSDGIQLGASPISGSFTLAGIRFKGLAPAQGTDVVFSRAWPRESKLTLAGVNVLGSAGGGSYEIAGGILRGTMQIAGRPSAPSNTQAVSLNVKFYAAGTTTLLGEATASSDANGAFTVLPVANGTYDIVLKHSQTLSVKKRNVAFSGGVVDVSFGMLPVGDANNDDVIDVMDFSILRPAFLKTCGQSGFDGRADFDADCVVDITDFSLLQANFLHNGPIVATAGPAGGVARPASGEVTISLQRPAGDANVHPGDIFTMDIKVAAGEQRVDGAQAVLTFDPTKLQVVDGAGNPAGSILAGSMMDSHFSNSVDNSTGRIVYADGQLNGAALTQSFTLASIRFKAVGSGVTTVAFATGKDIRSKITLAGLDVLHEALNGGVTVAAQGYHLDAPTLVLSD